MTDNKTEHRGEPIFLSLEDDCFRITGLKGGTSIYIKWDEVTVVKGIEEPFSIKLLAENL